MASEMKSLHVTTRIENSGPNKVLISLAKGLIALGHHVGVMSLQEQRNDPALVAKLMSEDILIEQVGHSGSRKGIWSHVAAMKTIVRSNNIDVIHAHCLRSLLVALLSGSGNVVVTSHNIPDEDWPFAKGQLKGWLIGRLHYALLQRADAVVSINDLMQSRIVYHGGKATLIPNPIDFPRSFRSVDRGPHFSLLCVGVLNRRKNQKLIIEALALLGERASCVRLMFVGEGPDFFQLRDMSRDLRFNVEFCGFHEDPSAFFQAADLFVSPALTEGMPISVLEAFSYGLPVLLSDIAGHRFTDAPSNAVTLFKPTPECLASELEEIIARRRELPDQKIVHWARSKFDSHIIAEKYVKIYRSVLDAKGN